MDDSFLKLPGIEQLFKEAVLTEDIQDRTPRITKLTRTIKKGMRAAARRGQEFNWQKLSQSNRRRQVK